MEWSAGRYGEDWKIILKERPDDSGGELKFERHSIGGKLGKPDDRDFKGSLIMEPQQIFDMRRLLAHESFFALPPLISPPFVTLDGSIPLTMTACLGTHCHKVQVDDYGPLELAEDRNGQRVLAVWDALLELMPVKPAWK